MNFNSRASPDKQHVVVWSVCQPRLVWLAPGPGPSVVRSGPPFRHNLQINVKILAARNSPGLLLDVLTTLTGKERALDCAIGASIDLPIQWYI